MTLGATTGEEQIRPPESRRVADRLSRISPNMLLAAVAFLVGAAILLMYHWMMGCYFMAIKRFAEYRDINDGSRSAAYRKWKKQCHDRKLERRCCHIEYYASHRQ